ncbi:hypothetical protein [Mangrovihabitans endophyticus]|uniref:Uncharacterized protein n=1 Tax=Mangrovihabitans endophyticus TaxID=1751298 RepID=A0A8J3FLV7_9ACTN|nr:hypothetical protein [Mangrovihabitans endophyticus]GGK79674.1 hypothetical protein GCM10012284_12110 [Mangrovihabitans endophyticus]
MSTFTITVTSDSEDGPQATVVAEGGPDGLRVHAVTVRLGADAAGFPGEIARLDFRSVWAMVAELPLGRRLGALPPSGEEEAQEEKATSPSPGTPQAKGVPDDLAVVYWRVGSVAKVATHYDVPRHIAAGWVRRLRDTGKAPDPCNERFPTRDAPPG